MMHACPDGLGNCSRDLTDGVCKTCGFKESFGSNITIHHFKGVACRNPVEEDLSKGGLYQHDDGSYTWIKYAICRKCGWGSAISLEQGPPKDPPATTPPCILDEAKAITTTTRRDEYGHPFDNFTQIAAEWSLELGVPVTAEQVARMMIRVKLVRLKHNPTHRDSILDIAGYANCMDLIRQRREEVK